MNDSKTTMVRDFFTALKCICLPFWGLFTDWNDKFPTLPYTSTSEISTLSYTWHLKMVPFLGEASLYSTPGHKQPKLSMRVYLTIKLFLEPKWAIDSEAMRARNCFSKIQLVGQKYLGKTTLAS